jgi:hypothetical protein
MWMTEMLTMHDFEPHLGTGFTITTDSHVEVLTLDEVTASKHPNPGGREPFSLAFTGSSNDLMLHSQMVHFTHPAMGEITMTISPFGRTEEGYFRYEAVYS